MRLPGALELAEELNRRAGILTASEVARRWSRQDLRAAVNSGQVERMFPGIYASRLHSESLVVRVRAATEWAGPAAVLIGAGAAAAWELLREPPATIRVAVPHGTSKPCPPWLRLRRTTHLPAHAMWFGSPIALPEVAVVTSFAELGPALGREVVYAAVQRGLVTADSLKRAEQSAARLPGRVALRRVIDSVGRGAESPIEESALRTAFSGKSFSGFVRQHRIVVDGSRYRLDMAHLGTRTVVELDGAGHGEAAQRLRDIRRDTRLASHGYLTLRFAGQDLLRDPNGCRELVLQVLSERVAQSHT